MYVFVNFPDEKRFACNICPARFKDRSSCRRHVHEHTAGKTHVCSICSVPFKRPAQLKNHLQQQHGTASSVLSAPGNMNSTSERFDSSTSPADLMDCNYVTTLYYSSSPAAVFAVGQQLQSSDAKESESSASHCRNSSTSCHNSETAESPNIDTVNQTDVGSSVFEVCENGFSMSDKSVAIAPQTLDYLHNSCSASESDVLFSHERTDSLPLPIPSLVEDSVTDVTTVSSVAGFCMEHNPALPFFNRPNITDETYLLWHVQFADSVCSATVPLSGDQLQAVASVWSSLVNDMTTLMTDGSISGQRQHYPALFDITRKLIAVVESHLQILQPTGTSECHK